MSAQSDDPFTSIVFWVRDRVSSALLDIDKSIQSPAKKEKRLFLLHAGAELEGAVREIEQMLKTEPPRC